MNIDERIEALTQTLELVASLQKDHEGKLERLTANVNRLTTSMIQLVGVVATHEQRLDDLEGAR